MANRKGPAEVAFPNSVQAGMELRDYFAAKVVQALFTDVNRNNSIEDNVWWAYQIADAMMKEREKDA